MIIIKIVSKMCKLLKAEKETAFSDLDLHLKNMDSSKFLTSSDSEMFNVSF